MLPANCYSLLLTANTDSEHIRVNPKLGRESNPTSYLSAALVVQRVDLRKAARHAHVLPRLFAAPPPQLLRTTGAQLAWAEANSAPRRWATAACGQLACLFPPGLAALLLRMHRL